MKMSMLSRPFYLRSAYNRWNDIICRQCQTVAEPLISKKATRVYGQPTADTHPHLLQSGEVTPGLTQEEFRERRLKLMELIMKQSAKVGNNTSSHLILIPSNTKVYMSDKIPYLFRQNSDFLYLSGFKEPDSVLLLHTVNGKLLPEHLSTLFIPKHNSYSEMWEGPKTTGDGAVELLGVDAAYNLDELEKFLECYARENSNFLIWYDYLNPPFPQLHETIRNFMSNCHSIGFESPRSLIHRLRLIKSPAEIKLMQKSCRIAAESMVEVMKFSHSTVFESHLHAKMEYECRFRGADYLAYPPVVAGGTRANTIHYTSNNQKIFPRETVLMDAGCEFYGYTSDLTRTWPVSGRFTNPQKQLYNVVLSVQEELIKLCGTYPSLDYLFQVMCQKIGMKLQELGIIPMNVKKPDLSKIAYNFCPHHVSHYLGMDVHDTNLISRSINTKPGMVITVEPGIYIKEDNFQVPAQYRGLGIRIEDDVLITDGEPEVLTSECPKTVEDIEKLFQ